MTLTEAALRSWAEEADETRLGSQGSAQSLSGPGTLSSADSLRSQGESPLPQILRELAAATTARFAGLEHAPVKLGAYELRRVIGSGGMGQVFAARSPSGQEVAIKLFNRSRPTSLRRLKQEFRVLADVRHANLVELEELVVLDDGLGFFSMELVLGRPLIEHLRDGLRRTEPPDLAATRAIFVQLLAAVGHLHVHGYVHRDLKPSNVLVSAQGRVVVLDFGLVYDAQDGERDVGGERLIGTPAYMAPEQSIDRAVGFAADLYAVGVMLFEACVGTRPFKGGVGSLLRDKRERDAPALHSLVPGIDGELAELCAELLARDPQARPTARDALARLGGGLTPRAHGRGRFIGREAELDELAAALSWVDAQQRPALARIHGPSGQGKSALARAFVSALGEDTLVLSGRCYERESLAYKGFDAAIDALSVHLRAREADSHPRVDAEHIGPLCRVFPVLAELWEQPTDSNEALSPSELRARALQGLTQLLQGVAGRRPLVLLVDDFHWADLASVQLLEALLSSNSALPLLLVLTHRPRGTGAVLDTLDALCGELLQLQLGLFDIPVGPLDTGDGLALALDLSGGKAGSEADEERARAYLDAAGGNPFYLYELTRGAELESDDSDLDRLVARRIAELAPGARRLLEYLALAGRPIARSVVTSLEPSAQVLGMLLEHDLLRTLDGRLIETSHDRIREVTVGQMDAATVRARAQTLVVALEGQVGPGLLAGLYELAGQDELAADHAQQAAERALASLAFERGAQWLERAARLCASEDTRRALELRRAEALANAGRFREAAALLMRCAEDGAEDAMRLRSRAVGYLVSAGWIDEGLAAIAELAPDIGVKVELRTRVLAPLVLLSRVRVSREIRRFRARPVAEQSAAQRLKLEVLHDICRGFAGQEVLQTNYWHLRWRTYAASVGDAADFSRTLAIEATITSSMHDGRRWRRLRARAEALMPAGDAKTRGWMLIQDMFVGVNRHRYADVLDAAQVLEKLLSSASGDMSWERSQLRQLRTWGLVRSGALREAVGVAAEILAIAREAGDRKLEREGMGMRAAALVRLGERDEAGRMFALLHSARRRLPNARFTFAELWAVNAWIESLLREGRYPEARAACDQLAIDMRRDGLWRIPAYRNFCLQLSAASELQAQLAGPNAGARRRRRRLTRRVRSSISMFAASAAVLDAGQAEIDGRSEQALASWQRARADYVLCNCAAEIAAIDARLARLLEGEAAAAAEQRAAAYFEREQIIDVEAFLLMLTPAPA